MLEEDFGKGGTNLDMPLACKITEQKVLNVGCSMLKTEISNMMKEIGSKGLENRTTPVKETRKSLEVLFEEPLMEGQPFTTRIERVETNDQSRDDIIVEIVLPPLFLLC